MNGHDQSPAFFGQAPQDFDDRGCGESVEAARRLVQKQNTWIGQNLNGNGDSSFLTAADALHHFAADEVIGTVTKTHFQ